MGESCVTDLLTYCTYFPASTNLAVSCVTYVTAYVAVTIPSRERILPSFRRIRVKNKGQVVWAHFAVPQEVFQLYCSNTRQTRSFICDGEARRRVLSLHERPSVPLLSTHAPQRSCRNVCTDGGADSQTYAYLKQDSVCMLEWSPILIYLDRPCNNPLNSSIKEYLENMSKSAKVWQLRTPLTDILLWWTARYYDLNKLYHISDTMFLYIH